MMIGTGKCTNLYRTGIPFGRRYRIPVRRNISKRVPKIRDREVHCLEFGGLALGGTETGEKIKKLEHFLSHETTSYIVIGIHILI